MLPLPTSLATQIFPPCSSTNFLAKVNPSPVPSTLVRIVAAHLAKLLEDPGLVLGCDADAGVSYRDLHSSVTLYGVNPDPSSLRSELHCIGQKIEKNLLDLALITDELAQPLVD